MLPMWRADIGQGSVISQWNDVIGKLGIDPIFPPEEDIYVGDVIAVMTQDNSRPEEETKGEPSLNKAIKIFHIDAIEPVLETTYEQLPIFPDTAQRPSKEEDPWPQIINQNGIFLGHKVRGMLALAAFPGFTIRNERVLAGGFAAWLGGLFGASHNDDELIEMNIPSAETYGIPSLVATGLLDRFCADAFHPNVCSDSSLRRQLSFINPSVLKIDTDAQGRNYYPVKVEVALINRVYLIRSIEETRKVDESNEALLKAMANGADQIDQAKKAVSPPPSKPEDDDGLAKGPASPDGTLRGLSSTTPNGILTEITSSGAQFVLKKTFPRPIAIGYRAVRWQPDDPNATKKGEP
ncbi:hypothetical protein ACMDCR_28210 [Labrys okinawensis]|uniref:hypothetical protein n=1 Tax=Labrys okinawensis TaxID=346911 RepID=UPI0039BD6A4B